MAQINSFRDLIVWQKSMDLAAEAYRIGRILPRSEEFRMTGQLLRAASSVAANIAEGHGRGTRKEYAKFARIARGSLSETETFLLLAVKVGLIDRVQADTAIGLCLEIGRMLNALVNRLQSPPKDSAAPDMPP